MKILSAKQLREAEAYTMAHRPIRSIDLMERAAAACTSWIINEYDSSRPFYIFCGMGNNGGDGLAVARMLMQKKYTVEVFVIEYGEKYSDDCAMNLQRLNDLYPDIVGHIESVDHLPAMPANAIVIDALFGTGLSRPVTGLVAECIQYINEKAPVVIAIDLPSGLYADSSSKGGTVIAASHTLTFETYKLAFLLPENEEQTGQVHVLPIGLHHGYMQQVSTPFQLTDKLIIKNYYKPRKAFSHKGTFGHALLVAGSYGKMGAAVLSSRACLHAGAGLLTTAVPESGYDIIQSTVPEAMCVISSSNKNKDPEDIFGKAEKYDVVGIGPGIDTGAASLRLLQQTLQWFRQPLVIDADALNLLAVHKELFDKIPAASILTPHPKEFERLFGKTSGDFERIALLREKAQQHNLYILLKGHYSCVACPDGNCFFNSTGNAGMATGGSGDVLTGVLTGLLAQHYAPREAAIIGMYLHGLSGDIAAENLSQEAILAGDIVNFLGAAYQQIKNY